MGDSHFVYRIRGEDSLSHAYSSPYSSSKRSGYNPVKRHERYEKTKEILGRKAKTGNAYGNYKSPYYDPVARHERYLRERSSLGIGKGTGKSKSSGRGGSGGSGRKGSGGSSAANNLSEQVQALRNESSLSVEAQREAAKRKIEALREDLTTQVQKLREDASAEIEKEDNLTAVRGITQTLKAQIESLQGKSAEDIKAVSEHLQDWIAQERDSLERRIAALYKSYGKTYTVTTQADKQRASDSRDKEVSRRADSIYKKKS